MKTSKILFFSTITLFGVMFAVFTVMAEAPAPPSSTPSLEVAPTSGPVIPVDQPLVITPTQVDQNGDVTFTVGAEDVSGIKSVIMKLVNSKSNIVGQAEMNDDGLSGDVTANDGIYSKVYNIGSKPAGDYDINIVMTDRLGSTNNHLHESALTIIGEGGVVCGSDDDCTNPEICCDTSCVYNECVADTDCVDQPDGTCDTSGCPNVCDYTPAPPCNVDSDCGSDPLDACCSGTCLISECAVDTDCVDQPNGTCNTLLCPNACEYFVDTTPPTLDIFEPLDGQIFTTDTIIVKAVAVDSESGIDKVEFEVDQSQPPFIQYFDQSSYGYPNEYWQTITFTNGSHKILVTAYDAVGNAAEMSVNVEFDLSSSGPIIDAFTTDKTSYGEKEDIQVSLNAHDDDSNIDQVQLYSSRGGGPIFEESFAEPTIKMTTAINAGSIVDWGDAFDTYAVRQDSFKLPFIKIADAQIINQGEIGNQNCTYIDKTFDRYIYAMVSDDTNPATQSKSIDLIITVTIENCK